MATVGIQKEEKKLLIGQFVGLTILSLLLLGWTTYIFVGLLRLNLTMMKRIFTNDPETAIYVFVPMLFVLLWILPRAIKIWKDISSNMVEEGTAEVVKVDRSWFNRDWLLTLNEPGKEKIRLLRKDAFKLIAGNKIKYRIAPSYRILVGYEILGKK